MVICPLRVSLTGGNISVDPLTTHLLINWRFPHGRHRRARPRGATSTWCVHTVDGYGDKEPNKKPLLKPCPPCALVPSSTLLGLMSLPVNSPISVSAHARAADTTSPHQRSTLRPPVGARSNERIHRLRGNEALTHPRLPAPSLASRGPGSSQPVPEIPAHHHDDLPVQRQFSASSGRGGRGWWTPRVLAG